MHAGWFNPTTGDVVITREELQLEAYVHSNSNCATFDTSKNAAIATNYFTANFANLVQFAGWNQPIPVEVSLKDNVNYRVSALAASLDEYSCELTYHYPE